MDILSDINVVGNLSVSGSIGSPGHPNTFEMIGNTLTVSEFVNFKFGIGVHGQNGIDLDVTGAGKFMNFAKVIICGDECIVDVGRDFGRTYLGDVEMSSLMVDNDVYLRGNIKLCKNPYRIGYSPRSIEISNFKAFPETFLIRVPENCSKFLIKDYLLKMTYSDSFPMYSEFLIRPLVNSYSGDLGTKRVDMDVEIDVTSEIGYYRESVLGVITPFSSVSSLFVSVSDSIM